MEMKQMNDLYNEHTMDAEVCHSFWGQNQLFRKVHKICAQEPFVGIDS